MDTLIAAVRSIQEQEHLKDSAVAARLGFTRTHWVYLRQGKRGVTVAVLRGIAKGFPQLAVLVGMSLTTPGQNAQEGTQEAQGVAKAEILVQEGRAE
jgi:hypothetical protein